VDYVTVRELREKSGEIWQRLEAGEEFVVTRNGKPFALLVHTEPQAVEERLRALRLSRLGDLVNAIRTEAQANGTSALSEAEIQAEIDAAHRERYGQRVGTAGAAAATTAPHIVAEPPPKAYARRR